MKLPPAPLKLVSPILTTEQAFAAALLGESPEVFARNERIEELQRRLDVPSERSMTQELSELSRLMMTNTGKLRRPMYPRYDKSRKTIGFKVE